MKDTSQWGIAGVSATLAIIVLSPLTFYGVDWFINKARGSDYEHFWATDGRPTIWAFGLHIVVFFFLMFMFLAVINWE